MVAADTVQGNITLRLKDVPWDPGSGYCTKPRILDKHRNGNVIWITVSELIKIRRRRAKSDCTQKR